MNIEELKTAWQQYGRKLSVSNRLNEQLLLTMLRERSRSRAEKIKRVSLWYLVWMCVILLLLTAIFVGNPFDFKYTLQFVPYGLLTIAVLLGAYELFKNIQRFDVPVTNDGLAEFLKKTINGYEKNKKAESWFGIILFSAGILTAFSFLPQKLEHKPLWQALGETGIAVLITVLIYSIAFKLGAFKNRGSEGFKNDWNELNELKAISYELGPME